MSETSLIVKENFLPNFYATREWALKMNYGTNVYKGTPFHNTSPDWGQYPTHLLEDVMGFPIQSTLSVLRFNTEEPGSTVSPFIHSDFGIDGAEWASVLYLSTPEQDSQQSGGTAFWRHKATGLRGLPDNPGLLVATGFTDDIIKQIDSDGFDETNWKLEMFTSMKSNRLIVYPSSLFHSRYPNAAFGTDARTGRLIWVNFFKGV